MEKSIWIGSLLSLLFLLAACSDDSEDPTTEEINSMEEIKGTWEGSIQVPNQPLPIIGKFEDDGGALSIPLQGMRDKDRLNTSQKVATPVVVF